MEGHTDSVGGDDYNQHLSEQRAGAARDYLIQNGIASNSVSAAGFGKTKPVTTNDTAAGRQQNRRVELVVSGDEIGNATSRSFLLSQSAPHVRASACIPPHSSIDVPRRRPAR